MFDSTAPSSVHCRRYLSQRLRLGRTATCPLQCRVAIVADNKYIHRFAAMPLQVYTANQTKNHLCIYPSLSQTMWTIWHIWSSSDASIRYGRAIAVHPPATNVNDRLWNSFHAFSTFIHNNNNNKNENNKTSRPETFRLQAKWDGKGTQALEKQHFSCTTSSRCVYVWSHIYRVRQKGGYLLL